MIHNRGTRARGEIAEATRGIFNSPIADWRLAQPSKGLKPLEGFYQAVWVYVSLTYPPKVLTHLPSASSLSEGEGRTCLHRSGELKHFRLISKRLLSRRLVYDSQSRDASEGAFLFFCKNPALNYLA